jgi:hypothetical protein
MKAQTHMEAYNRFHFGYFDNNTENEPAFAKAANIRLLQVLVDAPPGATAIGLVEKNDREFISIVRVRSPFRTFTASAAGIDAEKTVHKALDRLEDELYRWRYGSGSGSDRQGDDAFNQNFVRQRAVSG